MSAFTAAMRNQTRIVMTRPMNLASGLVTPVLYMTLLTAPRLESMTPEAATSAFTGSLLTSLWAASLWSGAGILRRERWGGTLAPSFTGRPSPVAVLVGKTLGGVLYDTGLILIAQTVFCLVVHLPLVVPDPVAFGVGIVAVIVCGVASSLMIGAVLMLSRYAFQLTTALGTPVMLLGGTLIPLSLLPRWVSWLGWFINLSWLQRFLVSTLSATTWAHLAFGVGISAVYALIGARAVHIMLDRARKEGTLDLV